MRTLTLIAAATAIIATSTAASAHDWRADRIDARQAEQAPAIAIRIAHDVPSPALSVENPR